MRLKVLSNWEDDREYKIGKGETMRKARKYDSESEREKSGSENEC